MAEGQEIVAQEDQPALFAPAPKLTPCSWNECLAGHRWPVAVVVAKCPGCGGAMLAIRQENCPFCNEPVRASAFRADIVPAGAGAVPRCQGAKPYGDTRDLILERNNHVAAQEGFKDFLTREVQDERQE